MMDLSLCMIVRDEETTLPTCLASVRGVVDEVVVVDTGSSDRTIDIARSFAARVYSFQWCDDFAVARNQSLQYAQGDWVLVLDADEVLHPEIVPALKQVVQMEDALVVTLLRQEVGARQAPYSLLSRLFRRHPDICFSRPYHELIDDSVTALLQREPHWRVLELPGVAIQHSGYQPQAIAQRRKYDRARRIMEAYLETHPDDAYLCNKLGALYAGMGELAKGREFLQRGLQTADEPTLLCELHYHLGSLAHQAEDLTEAAYQYQRAAEQPVSPAMKLGVYHDWGRLQLDQGNLAGAQLLYQKTVEIDPGFAAGYVNLGLVLKGLGRLAEAIAHYRQAIQLQPDYAEAHQNLAVALLKTGQVSQSMEAFRRAIDLYQQQNSPEAERLRQGLQEIGFVL
jgi:tetratricopeptide (TPR) repeat protein